MAFVTSAHGFLTMNFLQQDIVVVTLRSLYHAFIKNIHLFKNMDFELSSRNFCLVLSLCASTFFKDFLLQL